MTYTEPLFISRRIGVLIQSDRAAAVIKATGADLNFIPDWAVRAPTGPRSYEVEPRACWNPGPVRYVCRGEGCRAFGTARFGFTTEEEWISHWNTFHVAVMPQFVCQHAGCGATFAADPGALDKFLDHTNRRQKEEAAAGLARHWQHPILSDTTSLELRPNPFYRPPNRHDEVPQRLSSVQAPSEDLDCWTLEDRVLQLRWIFRWLFGKRVEQALIRGTQVAAKKRHQTSTPVLDITNPEKCTKSDPSRDQEAEGPIHDPTPANPRDSPASCEPQLKMSPALRLEHFRPLGKDEEMPGVIEGQEGTTCSDVAGSVPTAKPQGLTRKTKSQASTKSGTSARETALAEAKPSSKTKQRCPNPPSNGALSTKFGSALHPRNRTEWEQLCKATDMDTIQLKGHVGTPDDPLFTYEEAVRQRGTDQGLLLRVGQDIIPAEEDEFPKKKSEGDLKKLRKQAVEAQLPELPTGVLPGGWDALGRPWALIDCPAKKVPQIPSAHGTSRVTVATLVSFPPKPFFFVNSAHLDGVIWVKNKIGHSTYRGLQGELNEDQMLKDASRTYDRWKLPEYGDSVPFQECLKEPRWSAYREGRWGKRTNPPTPACDVRPGTMANVPVGERLVAPTSPILLDDESSSDSGSTSRSTSRSSESSPGPRQRVRRLTCRMLYSDPEEVSDSTTGEATISPTAVFPALCNPSDAVLTQAVNDALVYRGQVEANEAAASGGSPIIVWTSRARDQRSLVQQGGISPGTSYGRQGIVKNSDSLAK